MHQMHGQMAPGAYHGGQPSITMPPPPSGLGMPPPGQPASAGPPPQMQQMNQGTTAPPGGIYTQPGPGYAPQGYHLQPAQGGYPVHMVSGGPSAYQPAGLSQQPGGVYMTAPSVEYQPYNMQGMYSVTSKPLLSFHPDTINIVYIFFSNSLHCVSYVCSWFLF